MEDRKKMGGLPLSASEGGEAGRRLRFASKFASEMSGECQRRRSIRAAPIRGNPRAAKASVAGSGTPGVGPWLPVGVIVSVMLLSITPSAARGLVAVKKLGLLDE